MPGVYPENFELKIGFDKVRAMLAKNCISLLGREFNSKVKKKYDVS